MQNRGTNIDKAKVSLFTFIPIEIIVIVDDKATTFHLNDKLTTVHPYKSHDCEARDYQCANLVMT